MTDLRPVSTDCKEVGLEIIIGSMQGCGGTEER